MFSIFNNAPVGILAFSSEWKIEHVNDNFIKLGALYHLDLTELAGNNILKTTIFPDVSFHDELLRLEEGFGFERELKNVRTADRGSISLYVKASPIFENERFNGGILILEDISISSGMMEEKQFKAESFEKLFSRLDDILLITDNTGIVRFSYGKKLRRSKSEQFPFGHGSPVSELINPMQADQLNEIIKEVIDSRSSQEIMLNLSLGNTNSIPEEINFYECKVEPFINRVGQVQFIFFLLRDITSSVIEKKNYESEIKELKQYRVVSEGISDALFATNLDGKIIFWNDSSEKLFGFSKEEVYEEFLGVALGLFDEEYFKKIKVDLLIDGVWKVNLNIFKKDGVKETVEAKFSIPQHTKDLIIVLCSNISDRIEVERKLKQSEEKFRGMITQATELVCNIDPDGAINYTNQMFISSLKYNEDEVLGKKFIDFIDPEYLRSNIFDLKTFSRNKSKNLEFPLITKKGYPLCVLANFSPIYSDNNVLSSYNGYFIDISEQKSSEKNLTVFRSIFKASLDGIVVESEGKIIIANDAFANIFGYENSGGLINKEILDLISNTDTLRVAEYLKLIENKKQVPGRLECLGKRADGSNFYIEVSVGSFNSENKDFIVLIIRDITERKRAQQGIRDSEEKYRSVTENIDDFLYTFEKASIGFRPTFYTSSVEKVTGYSQTEFLSDSKLVLKVIHPDDFPAIKKKLKTFFRSRIHLSEEFEFRIINKHGSIVWVRNKINFKRTQDGKILRIYGLVSDITLRKNAEEELSKSTENLVKLNETKDKFISIISHDLRTPFTSILGFTDLLLSDEGLSEEERKQYVKFIRESSQSMLSLVNSLLDWTRLQTGRIKFEPEKIDVRTVVENSINSLSGAAFYKNIELVSGLTEELCVFVDKNLIMQVFNNLISNAIKFTKTGGKVIINASKSAKTRFYEFSVSDNGIGIKPENLKDLFRVDTKFTSEGTAGEKGSGLGLSLVKEIIDKHGGQIWVDSVYGSKTEFKFLLPVASADILLVDDSKTDRLLYSKILKNITPDYNIDIASNGKEALERILVSPPALVITDHLMPEMNGYEFIQNLKRSNLKGKPPVIVLSSELDRNIIAEYNEIGVEYVFSKPVNLSNFKRAVEKSLKKGLG